MQEFPDLQDIDVDHLVTTINKTGYGIVADYLTGQQVDELRHFVEEAVRAAGGQYVHFTGTAGLKGTTLEQMAESPVFRRLCTRIYEAATGKRAPGDGYYQILRCLSGASGEKHSLRFHYDSYVLTVLVPVHIPEGRTSGELILLPNFRKIRSWYALNLLDKLLVDNSIAQRILQRMTRERSGRLTRLKMKPGNLYVFWGYRSVHTNEPCDPDQIRATALFHYADPHSESFLKRSLRS